MAITLRQFNDKWRINVDGESWEFPDRKSLDAALKKLLDLKVTNGQLFQAQKTPVAQFPPHKEEGELIGGTIRPLKNSKHWGAGGDSEEDDGKQ